MLLKAQSAAHGVHLGAFRKFKSWQKLNTQPIKDWVGTSGLLTNSNRAEVEYTADEALGGWMSSWVGWWVGGWMSRWVGGWVDASLRILAGWNNHG